MIVSFELDKNSQRPIVLLDKGINALLDTGSQIPVWTAPEQNIKMIGGKKIKENVSFGGFGGVACGNLYRLENFCVGELVYPPLYIVACKMQAHSFHMILSATMFSGLIYEIDDSNHFLNVKIPSGQSQKRNVKIQDKNGKFHILLGDLK